MSLKIECLSPLLSCGLWGTGLTYKTPFISDRFEREILIYRGSVVCDFCQCAWLSLKVVLHFGNGKREHLQGAFPLKICKELVGPFYVYFHVITCLICLPLIADSCLLCAQSVCLWACVICSVKFSIVFHLKFFKSLTYPRLGVSLVACLSRGTDGVWTLLFQEGVYLRVVFCCW